MTGYFGFRPLEIISSGIPRGTAPPPMSTVPLPIAQKSEPVASKIPTGTQPRQPHALPSIPQWDDDDAVGWDDAFKRGAPSIDAVVKALQVQSNE